MGRTQSVQSDNGCCCLPECMQPKKAWVDVALLAGACALLAFGLTAYFQVGALHSLSHASYFAYGAWAGTALLVGGEIIWRLFIGCHSKEESFSQPIKTSHPKAKESRSGKSSRRSNHPQNLSLILKRKNVELRERILHPKPYKGPTDELAIALTHAHRICDNIVLGNYEAYLSLNPDHQLEEGNYNECLGKPFRLVITVTGREIGDEPDCKKLGICRKHIDVGDEAESWSIMHSRFKKYFSLIDQARVNGEDVLIHCSQGSSRSAAFLYAYLMYSCHVTAEQAYTYVHSIRPLVQLDWFKNGLLAYQAELGIED